MRMARNIYHRKDGRFEGRYPVGRLENGKTRYSSVFARSYAECRDKLEKARTGREPATTDGSVRAAVSGYLDSMQSRLKPSTLGVYRRYLESHIAPYFPSTPCRDLTTRSLQEFIDALSVEGLSPGTVQSVLTLLRAGVQSVSGPDSDLKVPRSSRRNARFFTADEQKRVERAARMSGLTDFAAVTLCLYTGMRIGEVCGLQFGDIDFDAGTLRVNRTFQRIPNPGGQTKTRLEFLPPKSDSSKRAIPVPAFLLSMLTEARESADCSFVISIGGKPVEPRALQYHFKRICSMAKVREVNFHATRHSFAVRALESGFDVKSLSEILGHSSASVTLGRYAHATEARKRDCMNALGSFFSQK